MCFITFIKVLPEIAKTLLHLRKQSFRTTQGSQPIPPFHASLILKTRTFSMQKTIGVPTLRSSAGRQT